MNAHGKRFVRGKALEDDLRSVIVDTILTKEGTSLRAFLKLHSERSDKDTKRPASVYYSFFERTKNCWKEFLLLLEKKMLYAFLCNKSI